MRFGSAPPSSWSTRRPAGLSLSGLLLLYNVAGSAWGPLLGDAAVSNRGLALVASALRFGFFAYSGAALTVVGRLILRAASDG